jgi:SAM-dependent methyltransferase
LTICFNIAADANILELGCGPAFVEGKRGPNPRAGTSPSPIFPTGCLIQRGGIWSSRDAPSSSRESTRNPFPLQMKHFDVVIANHMLYHVPDRQKSDCRDQACAENMAACLIATTVGANHMKEMYGWFRRK